MMLTFLECADDKNATVTCTVQYADYFLSHILTVRGLERETFKLRKHGKTYCYGQFVGERVVDIQELNLAVYTIRSHYQFIPVGEVSDNGIWNYHKYDEHYTLRSYTPCFQESSFEVLPGSIIVENGKPTSVAVTDRLFINLSQVPQLEPYFLQVKVLCGSTIVNKTTFNRKKA